MKVRPTARLIVLDDDGRTLLFRYEDKAALNAQEPDLLTYSGQSPGDLDLTYHLIDWDDHTWNRG